MMEVKIEKFQGPLGLLLQLIEKDELDITEIGLSAIADQYVNYIQDNLQTTPDQMANFLLVAARLLYIKSKALLPYLYNEEEETEIDDLKTQLRMYKEFIQASERVKELASGKRFLFAKPFHPGQAKRQLLKISSFLSPKDLTNKEIKQTFQGILDRLKPQIEKMEEARLDYVVTIEERISHIQGLLDRGTNYNFSSLINQAENKTEIIVNFLAVLELAKQRQLIFKQSGLFGEINIFSSKSI